jgi:hypothetical protein
LGAALVVSGLAHGLVDHYWSRGAIMIAWAAAGMATFAFWAVKRRLAEGDGDEEVEVEEEEEEQQQLQDEEFEQQTIRSSWGVCTVEEKVFPLRHYRTRGLPQVG